MRTTVRLDDHLFDEVKSLAARERRTFTDLFEEALQEMLARRRKSRERPRLSLPSFKGRGLQPGVDLDDSAALLELMEAGDDPR